jgi:hypothetical protein
MQGGSAVVLRSDVGWVVVGDGRGLRSGGRRSVREEGSVRVRRAERLETDPAHSQTGCAVLLLLLASSHLSLRLSSAAHRVKRSGMQEILSSLGRRSTT